MTNILPDQLLRLTTITGTGFPALYDSMHTWSRNLLAHDWLQSFATTCSPWYGRVLAVEAEQGYQFGARPAVRVLVLRRSSVWTGHLTGLVWRQEVRTMSSSCGGTDELRTCLYTWHMEHAVMVALSLVGLLALQQIVQLLSL